LPLKSTIHCSWQKYLTLQLTGIWKETFCINTCFLGLHFTVLTGTHDYNTFDRERQTTVPGVGRDVIIKKGAWLASNVTVIGHCIIGEHSVVAAGSVVNKDVPPYTIVGGIPAKVIRKITPPSDTNRTVHE
jgi:acetyltransferase-like isoleucine patch superfamily enzyme